MLENRSGSSNELEASLKNMFVCCLLTQNVQAGSVGWKNTFVFAPCPRKRQCFKARLFKNTVMILSFRTDMPGQTVQT